MSGVRASITIVPGVSKKVYAFGRLLNEKYEADIQNLNAFFIFFIFIFILLRRVALQPELFYNGPST